MTPSSIIKLKRNRFSSLLVVALMFTVVISMFALPSAIAHEPAWTIPTYAYITVSPNPVGVNEPVFLTFWIDKTPPTAAGSGGDRWTNYTVTVTKPDATTETLGPFSSAAESTAFTIYTPSQTGTYTFLFKFPGQVASLYNPINGQEGSASVYVNDTYLASQASATLTVQQDPLEPVQEYPLPTSYWTRPIEGQNTAWGQIASNWLGSPYIVEKLIQPNGAAPSTAHIMWTKALLDGGVVGGDYSTDGATYYSSLAYEAKFSGALIINGRLYYNIPRSNAATGNGYVCVDLRTGEKIFSQNMVMPTFAQLYDYESMNQHGIIPNGFMWRTVTDAANGGTVWMAYDSIDGNWLFNLTNVPSGYSTGSMFGRGNMAYGPNGEILYFQLNAANGWLALWNNTAAWALTGGRSAVDTSSAAYQWRPIGENINASTAYSWNVSVSELAANAAVFGIIQDDVLLVSANFPSLFSVTASFGTPDNCQVWAISLKPSTRGQLLWTQTYAAPQDNLTRGLVTFDPANRVFIMYDKETMQYSGYSIDNGNKLWGPVGDPLAFQYFGYGTLPSDVNTGYAYDVYEGRLYVSGWGGLIYCYNTANGNLLWTYGNGGEGNSTNSGLATPWGYYPTFAAAFADGKIYLYTTEHSPNVPPYKGAKVRCLDAETGEELWTILGWSSATFAIADGYGVYLNVYDNQLYCVGKGPSSTTVIVQNDVVTQGNTILIKGTVNDISAGAKQLVNSGEFNTVPAISDDSMGEWMEYLYMQKPCPADATGVAVHLTAVDSTGTTHDIGYTTSDASGLFKKAWTPPVEGEYTIIATFEGSEGYYQSSARTAIAVVAAPENPATTTPAPTESPTQTAAPTESPTESPSAGVDNPGSISTETLLIAGAAAVIVIAVIAAALVLRKRQ